MLTDLRQKQPHASAGQELFVYPFILHRWFFGVGTVGDVAPQVQNLLVQEAWNPMMVMMQLWGRLAGYQGYQGVMES